MKTFTLIAVLLAALIAQAKGALLTIDGVTCTNMSLSINATREEFAALPGFLRVTISASPNGQTQVASIPDMSQTPEHGTDLMAETTLQFTQAFVLPTGNYPMVLDLITSSNTNNSVASFKLAQVPFEGCYSDGTTSSPTSLAPASAATASFDPSSSSTNDVYYPPLGVPTQGIFPQSSEQSSDSGLSSGTKIGITMGVLAAALIATIVAMAFVIRRWRQKQQGGGETGSGGGSKARRYANGRWVTEEDRNSAELKEVHNNQV